MRAHRKSKRELSHRLLYSSTVHSNTHRNTYTRQSEAEGKGETRIYTQKDISNHTNTLEAIHHSKTHHSTHTQRTHRHIDTHMHARKYNT